MPNIPSLHLAYLFAGCLVCNLNFNWDIKKCFFFLYVCTSHYCVTASTVGSAAPCLDLVRCQQKRCRVLLLPHNLSIIYSVRYVLMLERQIVYISNHVKGQRIRSCRKTLVLVPIILPSTQFLTSVEYSIFQST